MSDHLCKVVKSYDVFGLKCSHERAPNATCEQAPHATFELDPASLEVAVMLVDKSESMTFRD